VGVGFLMTNSIWKVAKQFPNIKFALIDGAPANDKGDTENLPNVANLFFKEQEPGYVVGVIAAMMAKDKVGKATHNTVCSMGGIPIPSVDRWIAGYQDAVKTISPTTTILHGYSNDFVDQAKGKEVGLNHISKGCDILFQVAGGSGLGYIAAAKEKGVYAIGVDVDQIDVAPGTVITSAMKRVDKAVYDTSNAVKSGSFKAGDNFFSATNDGIAFGKLDPVAAYIDLFRGAFVSPYDITETLIQTIPLVLAGLAVAVAFRTGLFNIGAESQLLIGAVAAGAVGARFADLPGFVLFPMVLAA